MTVSAVAINGHPPVTCGFVGGDADETGIEAALEVSSGLETRLSFFADCFLVRERKGKREAFWALAFRRAGSTAVGSSSTSINWGKRGFEEDEADMSAIVELGNSKGVERDQTNIKIIGISCQGANDVDRTMALHVAQVPPAVHFTQTRSTPACGSWETINDRVGHQTCSMSEMPFCSSNAASGLS